jgi:glycosyltransferase involved in cell wall biosynthesis
LRAAVESLLADPDLRRSLGEAGRAIARKKLSWDVATNTTVAAYRAALDA